MPNSEVYFLTEDLFEQITGLIDQFIREPKSIKPEQLVEVLKDILPIEKMNRQTLLRRVEGYSIATDILWEKVTEIGGLDRQQIVTRAKLKPMSYYHYLTGSREAPNYAKSRDDLMNDPSTALVKLKDDILGLTGLIVELLV